MKGYQITIDGRTFEVRLLSDPHQDRVEVEVDGQSLVVDVQNLDAEERGSGSPGPATPPALPSPAAEAAPKARRGMAPAGAPSARVVAAPLPGVVKSVAVRPGQGVGPGDVLLVIEAMKMDNVIRAARQGVVAAVHVAEGHRVAHGQPLLEYRE